MFNAQFYKEKEQGFLNLTDDEKLLLFQMAITDLKSTENSAEVAWTAHERRSEQLQVAESKLSNSQLTIFALMGYPKRLSLPAPEVCHV